MRRVAVLASTALVALSLTATPAAYATAPSAGSPVVGPVSLGATDSYAVLAGSYVTLDAGSAIRGDVGAGAAITGGSAATVTGTQHDATDPTPQATSDLATTYTDLATRPATTEIGGELGGATLAGGGVYHSVAAFGLTGTLTLDAQGNNAAIFVLQTPAALVTAASSTVTLTGGATASNVFWQVGSYASFGAHTQLAGTVVADSYISFGAATALTGRALSTHGYVVLDSSTITKPTATTTQTNPTAANATAGSPVNLGAAQPFAILAGTYVTTDASTTITGGVGASTAITGGAGTTHPSNDAATTAAQADAALAYTDAAGRTPTDEIDGELGGLTLHGGVHHSASALGLTGTLTLDGDNDPSTVFIIQTPAALVTAATATVTLTNQAQPSNVFWAVGTYTALGATTQLSGALLTTTYISLGAGVTLTGHALSATSYVVADSSHLTIPIPTTPQPALVDLGAADNLTVAGLQSITIVPQGMRVPATKIITDNFATNYYRAVRYGKNARDAYLPKDGVPAAIAAAYADAQGRKPTAEINGQLGGHTFTRGVYHTNGSFTIDSEVTLDGGGDPDAVFIFQTDHDLNANASVKLVRGAQPSHIFWVTNYNAWFGYSSMIDFQGTILAGNNVSGQYANLHVHGRIFTREDVLLNDGSTIGP